MKGCTRSIIDGLSCLPNDNREKPATPEHVREWLNTIPKITRTLPRSESDEFADSDLEEEQKLKSKIEFSVSTEEENYFRRLVVGSHNKRLLQFTSKPVSVLSCKRVDAILEFSNMKIDEHLTKIRVQPDYHEHEYVNGNIKFPINRKTKLAYQNQGQPSSGSSNVISRIKAFCTWTWTARWLETILRRNATNATGIGINEKSEPGDGNGVVIEPYHGPVFVNGSTIKAGISYGNFSSGLRGSVVEEIKLALKAIRSVLRQDTKIQPKNSSASESSSKNGERAFGNDSEIQKLTCFLQQSRQSQKKSTLRTIFGLKNLQTIPVHNRNRFGRRYRIQYVGHRRRFLGAVNGWIQRNVCNRSVDSQRNSQHPYRNARLHPNRTSAGSATVAENTTLGNIFNAACAHIRTLVASVRQFQVTPGVAVPESANTQNCPQNVPS